MLQIVLVLSPAFCPSFGGRMAATQAPTQLVQRCVPPASGLLDDIGKIAAYNVKFAKAAFENMFDDRTARASHILLKGPSARVDCLQLKERIEAGEFSFADAAAQYSTCPSAKNGGDLGTFKKGAMVPEFDEVVFNDEIPLGEIRLASTQFGVHLIQVGERSEKTE